MKARKQEQIPSSSNHTLGFQGYLGEIQQQSMLPAHGTQLGANDRKMDVFEASCSRAIFLSPAFMVSLSTLSVSPALPLGRGSDPRRSQTRATKLAATPMFTKANFSSA
jgi:hypothetical protein